MLGGTEEEHEQGHLQAPSLRNSGWVPIQNAKSLHGMEERHAYMPYSLQGEGRCQGETSANNRAGRSALTQGVIEPAWQWAL